MLFFLSGLILLCVCKFVKSGVNPDRFSVYSTLNKTVIRTHFLQTFVEKQELHSYNASLAFVCPELQMCGSQSHNIREPFDYNAFRGNCCPPCECYKTCFTTGTCCYDKYLPAQEKPLIGHRKREVQAIFVSLDSNLEKCHYVYIGGGGRTIDYIMTWTSLKSYIMTKSCEPMVKEIDRNIIKKMYRSQLGTFGRVNTSL